MKKLLAIGSLLLVAASVAHAGFLDKLSKASSDVENAKKQVAETRQAATDPKAMLTLAIKNAVGAEATKQRVTEVFGEPSIAPFKNTADEDIFQYDISAISKSLGEGAALASSFGVNSKLNQVVQISFAGDKVSNYAVLDLAAAATAE